MDKKELAKHFRNTAEYMDRHPNLDDNREWAEYYRKKANDLDGCGMVVAFAALGVLAMLAAIVPVLGA